ncbi:helix-turn-helix domain-containing protein [Heyndrickxia sporothermodurans]|uniref:helix-turn-helix domain-containing protein n=1 Tax=Heyndrickxia sporothermodurans TaxID=46224 RepID=UPI002E21BD63|nr:helix-turn-helix domain-containing protein [Heyndrickxia sporothermodurans]MED3651702.1 helix-turn-helix domain-containing protein [Heyndrickxia sporothermodurans]MED3653866.1 helix-turn-helix domain-containing protein [Heyndrickxia sporothermodurans]MED3699345.1 helix-turn-helix domain-containing protein [Heyndrickxia sporothermodurans]
MSGAIEESYQISLQNIQHHSQHINLGIEILLVIRGEIEVVVNQDSYHLVENDLLLINANQVHNIKGIEDNVVLLLQIPLRSIERYYQDIHECYFDCYSSKEDHGQYLLFDQIRQLLAEILIAHYQKQDGSELETTSLIYKLVTILIRNFKTTYLQQNHFISMKDERIKAILAYIEKNYRKSISLEEIAKQQYLSLYYLSRYFKQEVGVSFSQYVKQVRLKSAVRELLYTGHTITQVALNNGFPNAKAFNKAFKEVYQQTPAEYRNLHKKEPDHIEEVHYVSDQYTLLKSPNFLIEISKYIPSNEKIFTLMDPAVSTVYIDLPKEPIFIRKKDRRLLVIGQLEYALQEEVQAELRLIQELLQFEYVYFTNLFSSTFTITTHLLQTGGQFYQINTLFNSFRQLGLAPFIRVEFEKEVERSSDYIKMLGEFLQQSVHYFGSDFVEKWQFELAFEEWGKTAGTFYRNFYETVKKWSSATKVGLYVPFSLETGITAPVTAFLKQFANECELVCFTCNPNEQVDFTDMNNSIFEGVKDFLMKSCIDLKAKLQSVGLTDSPIYLTNWNTLYGNTVDLSGSFFRSSLIFKDMFNVMKIISGLGFWIDTHSLEINNWKYEHIAMNGIALLYYYQLKRPAFFNIQLMAKMNDQILAEGEGFVLTKGDQGYQLAIYNTSYVNPSYSVESFFLSSLTKEKKFVISGLPHGSYQIRKHILDRKNGAFYMKWMNFKQRDINDQETITFLKQRTYPGLQIYEENIDSDLYLQSTLTLNAFHLIEIKPLS